MHLYIIHQSLWFLCQAYVILVFFGFSSMESTVVQKEENKVTMKTLAVYHHQVRELSILTVIIIQSFPLHFVLWLKKTLYQIKY